MDEVLQLTAQVMSLRSTCPSTSVGAVYALDGRILATGYNGAPAGLPHCQHPPRGGNDASEPTCRIAVHAEANGLAFAARHGIPLGGSTVYSTLSPCGPCARLLVNAGVVRFVAASMYRDHAGVDVLRTAGVAFDWIPLAIAWYRVNSDVRNVWVPL